MEITPRSKIQAALRQLWLRSKERTAALKRDDYTCQDCKSRVSYKKGAEFKVQVHHKNGVDWDMIIKLIYEQLLCNPKNLVVLCKVDHDKRKE